MKNLLTIIGAALFLILTLGYSVMPAESNDETMGRAPHHTTYGFQNYPPVQTAAPKGLPFYLRRLWSSIFLPSIPNGHWVPEAEAMKSLSSIGGDRITWLGHASFLIRVSGKTILTDPFLTEFASPLSWAGPRRFAGAGIPMDRLPPIDIIIVSHDHYDHLDDESVRCLDKDKIEVVVPLGLKSFFSERGYGRVTELDWNESIALGELTLTALPAIHNSGRSIKNRNQTLWASWLIESSTKKMLFVGDTGYSETIFKLIGRQYGPLDYAILPIGAYAPRKLMRMSHINPEEAVTVGNEIRAFTLIASHWGTIGLSDEPTWEPPKRFSRAGLDNGLSEERLWIMKIGETRPLGQSGLSQGLKKTGDVLPK
ncbi:MBL fold metallo-hydrolase [Desulfotalea psychrophila]|nr:MBL fold metallo-hydrolase [Desulfotalea psychrophila]